ncbi:sensor histidine kinase [Brevibacillus ginsengisoli]|uniref:sensor histidine kinase n=1 Tax=Brevibacillus ginsengisoli TaxID=363854 RepID=UPI003CF1A808
MKTTWNLSFPLRIAVRTGLAMTLVLFLIIVSAYFSVAWLMNRNTNSMLLVEVNSMISRWTQDHHITELEWKKGYYRVLDSEGNVILQEGKLRDSLNEGHEHVPLDYKSDEGEHFSNINEGENSHLIRESFSYFTTLFSEKARYREVNVPFSIGDETYMLELAVDLEDVQEFLHTVLMIFISISVGGVLLITSVVSYSTIRAFRPIREIAEKLQPIEQKSLSTQIELPVKDRTLQGLVQGINAMLGRLYRSFLAQSMFVQDASHELRTPLAVLRSEIEITLRRPRTEVEYQESLKRCLTEVDHMTSLSTQLLTLARFEQGKQLVSNTLPIDEVLEISIQKAKHFLKSKQIDFIHEKHGFCVQGDRVSLEMVFTNLIKNAITAIDSVGTIEISSKQNDYEVFITIKDNGCGIPEEAIPKLFDRFYRVDESRNRQSGGTGLGLAICHSIIEAHHGRIEVSSSPGKGSEFRVYFTSRKN